MTKHRSIKRVAKSVPTIEGAGVHLKRAFGFKETSVYDPFLLLDDFHSSDPAEFKAGFPWHPHRGIETVTYMIEGRVDHGDSLGNKGSIGPGDIQWMTAGSGIIHQEMPKGHDHHLWGTQLWVNLPASQKMTDPKYREVKADGIPEVELQKGVRARLVCGSFGGVKGPIEDVSVDPTYMDVSMDRGVKYLHTEAEGRSAFIYVLSGKGNVGAKEVHAEDLVLLGEGDSIELSSGEEKFRFLYASGRPIKEPVAWYGPIVMNTQKELEQAFDEYRKGTFIKKGNDIR
ncbi:MAG: pirin family protein [Candidatus Thermoplasmatota archaeon]|jgi:hypothetical protein|nr:pirin family protein [Candidatus Thermoplasmatota archaeon]